MVDIAPVTIGHASDVAELDDLSQQMNRLVERADAFVVKDDESRDNAVDYLKSLKAVAKVIEAVAERFRAPAYAYYCQVRDEKKAILGPAEKAEAIIKGKLADYRKECEEVAAALIREELEKRRTEDLVEVELAYRQAVADGDVEKAVELGQEIRHRAPDVDNTTEVAIESGLITETEGVSYREYWYADLESPASLVDLVQAVARGDAPLEFLTINKTAVNTAVKKQKGAFRYPGLKSWSETKLAVGS